MFAGVDRQAREWASVPTARRVRPSRMVPRL